LIRLGILLVFLIFVLDGCNTPFNPPILKEAPYESPVTPKAVIDNLRTAYMAKDLEGYLACLDPDSYRFYFDESDTATRKILEQQLGLDSLVWGITEERISAEALFSSVQAIHLDLMGGILLPDTVPNRRTYLYTYSLSIDPPPPGVEAIEGRAKFVLKKRPDGLWYIIRWEDYAF